MINLHVAVLLIYKTDFAKQQALSDKIQSYWHITYWVFVEAEALLLK